MSAPRLRLLQPVLHLTDPVRAAPPPAQHRTRDETGAFARFLLDEGVISAHGLIHALAQHTGRGCDLGSILLAQGLAHDPALTRARARWHALSCVHPVADPPDVRLIDQLGATVCLCETILPWRRIAEVTIILTDRPDTIPRHRERLEALFGRISFALSPRADIEAALQIARSAQFRHSAETRTHAAESCRGLETRLTGRWPALALAAVAALSFILPGGLAGVLTLIALTALIASMGLKTAALIAALRRPPAPPAKPAVIARLPVVSIIVALYREADIAPRLVRRLGRLDYPRERLDVILAVEEDDTLTRAALAQSGLPAWMRMIVVPHGTLKTKPRALNYALDFCRGSLVGIYDAEDAPDPAQIHAVVDRFHQRGPQVACLQGVLDYYNPRTNWMARCFTMEYAAWFRVILPGLDRLGLPIPLGGTTLFFRRAALEQLGGWDAHNVTEDADLGMRLYRHGYRTELINTVTEEEANCRALPWVKQRSRWIKGYMMTWRVHMRDPARLWRDLGPKGFVGFQVLFLGSLTHALLGPLLLSFWIVSLGLPHPVADALPGAAFLALIGIFLLSEALNLTLGFMALRRTRHGFHPAWLLTLHAYHPLATFAAYKALWEMVWRPFYWDKTHHGKFDPITEA